MSNEELIKTLRWCGSDDERHEWCVDASYSCPMWNEDRMTDYCKADLMLAAANALEADEQRIAELEAKLAEAENSIKNYKDLYLSRKREELLLAQQIPKEGEWIWDSDTGTYHCSECNATSPREDQDGEYIDCPNFCPNCGAKMKGEQDG